MPTSLQKNMITQTPETQSLISPSQAIEMLREGDARFAAANPIERNLQQQVNETSKGQYPSSLRTTSRFHFGF